MGDISPREGVGETRHVVKWKNEQLLIFASRGRYVAYALHTQWGAQPASHRTAHGLKATGPDHSPDSDTRTADGIRPPPPNGAAQEML